MSKNGICQPDIPFSDKRISDLFGQLTIDENPFQNSAPLPDLFCVCSVEEMQTHALFPNAYTPKDAQRALRL